MASGGKTTPMAYPTRRQVWSVRVLLFIAVGAGSIHLGLLAADAVMLRSWYGADRVRGEGLSVVRHGKHDVVISNGERLPGSRWDALFAGIVLPLGFLANLAAARLLPPGFFALGDKERHPDDGAGCGTTVLAVALAPLLSPGPFGGSGVRAAVVATGVFAWAWARYVIDRRAAAAPR